MGHLWNYRVVRRLNNDTPEFGIHEVYYAKNGLPTACSADPITVTRSSVNELRAELQAMLKAFNKPILKMEDF